MRQGSGSQKKKKKEDDSTPTWRKPKWKNGKNDCQFIILGLIEAKYTKETIKRSKDGQHKKVRYVNSEGGLLSGFYLMLHGL